MADVNGRANDEAAIRNVLASFAHAADSAPSVRDVADLFDEAGVWKIGDSELAGRAAITVTLSGQRDSGIAGPGSGSRHVLSEAFVTVDSVGATATARSYFVFVKSGRPPQVLAVGEYIDSLVNGSDGRWRFARREVVS